MLDDRIEMETDNSKLNSLILLFVFDKNGCASYREHNLRNVL